MQLKVVSLNLWAGSQLFDKALEFLDSQSADIVLLQEVTNSTDETLAETFRAWTVLKQKLNFEYSAYAESFVYDLPEGNIPQGNAILSRFPIISSHDYFLIEPTKQIYKNIPEDWPLVPRLLQHATMDANGLPVNVFNIQGVWDLDGGSYSPARQKMSDTLLEKTAGLSNVILAGDTNAKPTNEALLRLEPQLKAVFGKELKTTFNMTRKTNPGYASAAVDLMFVSPNVEVVDKTVPDIDISDHLPIVATLAIS